MTRAAARQIVFVVIGLSSAEVFAQEPPAAATTGEPSVLPQAPPEQQPTAPPATPPALSPPVAPVAPVAPVPKLADDDHEATDSPLRGPRFGDAGQFALDGVLSASFGHLGYSSGPNTSTSFSIEPAFHYFSSENFSEGASVFFRYSDATSGVNVSDTNVQYGVSVQLGGNIWLGEHVSFWPRLELGVWQSRTTYHDPYGGTVTIDGTPISLGPSTEVTENTLFVDVFAPFLFHLAPHFFVGIGPQGYVDVLHSVGSGSNLRRFLGASSTIGGWF